MRESTRTPSLTALLVAVSAVIVVSSAGPALANKLAGEVAGTVVATDGRWGYGGTTIVTETVIEQADGTRVKLHQLGGRVGDVAMVVTHSPPVLAVGSFARVDSAPARGADGSQWLRLTRVLEASSLGPHALPFVRTTTEAGSPLFWESGCTTIGIEASGASTIEGDGEVAAVSAAIDEWRGALSSCSYLDLRLRGRINVEPRFDGVNVIRFREDRWCRPAAGSDPEVCHDRSAAALTFLTFGVSGERNGAILDADIEMNGVDFRLTVDGQGSGSAPCSSDIQNTMTHELGHFLGLDHTCWDGRGNRPLDGQGAPVLTCLPEAQLPSEAREATMYSFQDCGETKKQSLETDDASSMCALYPLASDPGECTHPNVARGGFCSAASGSRRGNEQGALMILFSLVVLFGFRRRRSRSH